MKAIGLLLVFAAGCFFIGYQFALSTHVYPNIIENDRRALLPTSQSPQTNKLIINTTNNDNFQGRALSQFIKNTGQIDHVDNIEFVESEQHDIESILANIDALRSKENSGQLIAKRVDELKRFLITHPEKINDAVAQLDNLPTDSTAFTILLSAIQSAPEQVADNALISLAEKYAMNTSPSAQHKFMTILARTSLTERSSPIASPLIVQSLIELSIFEESDLHIKLEALNIIKPFQLGSSETDLVVDQLQNMLRSASKDEAEMLLPQLVRFTQAENRANVVSTFLRDDSSVPLRLAVLENIDSGNIQINSTIKTVLMTIANNSHDSLRNQAQETLMLSGILTFEEYSQFD